MNCLIYKRVNSYRFTDKSVYIYENKFNGVFSYHIINKYYPTYIVKCDTNLTIQRVEIVENKYDKSTFILLSGDNKTLVFNTIKGEFIIELAGTIERVIDNYFLLNNHNKYFSYRLIHEDYELLYTSPEGKYYHNSNSIRLFNSAKSIILTKELKPAINVNVELYNPNSKVVVFKNPSTNKGIYYIKEEGTTVSINDIITEEVVFDYSNPNYFLFEYIKNDGRYVACIEKGHTYPSFEFSIKDILIVKPEDNFILFQDNTDNPDYIVVCTDDNIYRVRYTKDIQFNDKFIVFKYSDAITIIHIKHYCKVGLVLVEGYDSDLEIDLTDGYLVSKYGNVKYSIEDILYKKLYANQVQKELNFLYK